MSPRLERFLKGRSLAACVDDGRDNILLLRLLAALLVVFGHSYFLSASPPEADPLHRLFPTMHAHIAGVAMFFAISGFLITLSWQRRPDLLRFLRARALRLWPALIVCVFAWAFVIGPLLSTLPASAYFAGDGFGDPLSYALGNASLFVERAFLPGVFAGNPIARQVNGSLWTIPVEATLYLAVAAAGTLRLFRFPWLASAAIAVAFLGFVIAPMLARHESLLPWLPGLLAGFFGAGSIACLLRRYVPVSSAALVALAVLALAARKTPLEGLAVGATIGYFVLWFAYVPRLPSMPRGLDLSYGTYLWAFPVQQTLVMAGLREPLVLFATAAPIVLLIAAVSWTFVEKRALRLKEPRRRVGASIEPA
ncbi:MAG TPA: acyltransferase [Rhodanobacteraceae bacterium]|nr:acyltransferase [Rhodanobacteraceae bacterium]